MALMTDRSCCSTTVDVDPAEATTLHLDITGSDDEQQTSADPPQKLEEWEQHSDPDVIIPDHIARPLVYSAHLLLVTAIFAFVLKVWSLGVVAGAVYVSSILHWSAPRFSSWRRYFDYGCVIAAIVVACILVLQNANETAHVVWFVGLGLVGLGFFANETRYYFMRPVLHGEALNTLFHEIVWTHLCVVHISINGLGLYVLIKIYGWP